MREKIPMFPVLSALAVLSVLAALYGSGGTAAEPAGGAASIAAEGKRYAALTFDDGPRPGTTDRLLDGLKERGAAATFFVIGEEAAAHPELIERMHREGCQIGNHTWGHSRLESLSPGEIVSEVSKTEDLLHSLTGESGFWLRPPYGWLREGTEDLIPVPVVRWSVDPRDWESRNTAAVVDAVLEAVEPDSIILLHDIYPTSVDAALELADRLPAMGYELVTVEELLRRTGIEAEPGRIYRKGGG